MNNEFSSSLVRKLGVKFWTMRNECGEIKIGRTKRKLSVQYQKSLGGLNKHCKITPKMWKQID